VGKNKSWRLADKSEFYLLAVSYLHLLLWVHWQSSDHYLMQFGKETGLASLSGALGISNGPFVRVNSRSQSPFESCCRHGDVLFVISHGEGDDLLQ
jgi:hypothetical protein